MTPQPINLEKLPSTQRVLVLAPHPDDFDAIGVTLQNLHMHGNPIFVAIVSGSSSGVLDSFVGPTTEAKELAREEEQRNSIRFFGLPDDNLTFLRLPEDSSGDPIQNENSRDVIRQHMEAVKPDIVFLPHGNDTNLGHQRVFAMFHDIASHSNHPITAFYIHDPKTRQISTNVYTGFDEKAAQWKRELLRHHKSQQHRNMTLRKSGFDDRILKINADIARDLNIEAPHAEAFQVEQF